MKRFNLMVVACVLLLCMLLSGCNKEPIAQDATLMTIDGEAITMEEYRYYYLSLKSQYDRGSSDYWKNNAEDRAELKTLANQYVLQYAAYDRLLADNNYVPSETENTNVDEYLSEMRAYYETEEKFQQALTDSYLTEELYRESLLRTEMLNRFLYDYNMENNAEEMKEKLEEYARVKHVLVKFGGTDGRSQEDAKKLAEQIAADARDGADFDELVAEYGEDPGMENNTDGYYFTTGEMVAEFEEASFDLKENEVSDPVESTYGYHVILRLPMEDSYLKSNFAQIFTGDVFYEEFDKDLEAAMDALEVTYEKVYDNVDIETVL